MIDFFWQMATSYAVLGMLSFLLVAALVIGHVPFGRYMPVIAPYVVLASFAAYLFLGMLTFLIGVRAADERAATQRLTAELAFTKNQLNQQRASAEDAERLQSETDAKAVNLEQKVSDYEARLAKLPAAACALDDADISGLRDITR